MANLALHGHHDDAAHSTAHGFGGWAVTAGLCFLVILWSLSGPFLGYLKSATGEYPGHA